MTSKVETRSRAASSNSSPKVNGPDINLVTGSAKQLENKINNRLVSLEKILESFTNEFKSQLADIKLQISNLESVFDGKLNDHRIEIGAKITSMESVFESKLSKYREIHDELISKVSAMDERLESMERRSIASDIIITGVPALGGDDPGDVFGSIARALDIQLPEGVNVFRAPSKRKANNTLIAKLPSMHVKKVFLKKYYSRMRGGQALTLRALGYESDSRIFINESLTSRMYGIRRFAERLKRNGEISSVFTLNGAVFVRVLAGDEAVSVKSVEFLEAKLQRRRSV